MATLNEIRTVERLMQTLDDNPPLLEALRARVLTRELLEMPANHARLTGWVEQIAGQLARLTVRFDQLTERFDQLTARVEQIAEQLAQLTTRVDRIVEQLAQLTTRVDQLTARVDQIAEQLAQLTTRVDQLTEWVGRIEEQLSQLTARADQIEQQLSKLVELVQKVREDAIEFEKGTRSRFDRNDEDMAWMKDFLMVMASKQQAMDIAEDLGLAYGKRLTKLEIRDLVHNQDTTGIAPGDLRSFRRADMIIEATDAAGQLNYIAVEVSFTADQRDTDRPIRNAGYLTRFTGQPAHAVVASVRTDNRIHAIIESGQIYWYRLYAKSGALE